MLNKQLNMQCPYCGQHQVEVITEIDPMSFNYHELTKTVCMFCGKVIEPSESVTYSNSTDSSYTTTSSAYKYCDMCNTKMEKLGDTDWWMCPNCHYGHMDYIGDPPKEIQLTEEEIEMSKQLWEKPFFIKGNESKFAIGSAKNLSNTIQFDRCERIIFRDKTLDFQFEILEELYKDIDTIIVNGHKFVRDKSE